MTQGGRRGSKNPPRFASTKQIGDPQRSARIACKIMQKDSSPENPKRATPHVTHANTGTPLAALARGLDIFWTNLHLTAFGEGQDPNDAWMADRRACFHQFASCASASHMEPLA